jgi:quinol monooxygenase YgiN
MITIALQDLAAAIRSNDGCLGCSVSSDLSTTGVVRYSEQWRTESDLRERLQSDMFVRLAALLDSTAEAPTIEFDLGTSKRGLDYLEEVRVVRP